MCGISVFFVPSVRVFIVVLQALDDEQPNCYGFLLNITASGVSERGPAELARRAAVSTRCLDGDAPTAV